jgi:hypothetical protein
MLPKSETRVEAVRDRYSPKPRVISEAAQAPHWQAYRTAILHNSLAHHFRMNTKGREANTPPIPAIAII